VEVGRKAVRSGAGWGLVFGFYVVLQTMAYVSAYKTQAARDDLAEAFGTNVGINALVGPARAINTVAGYASWRALGVLSLIGGIWGLLTATRLLRGEEDSGRYELLLAGQTTRGRAGAQALAGLAAGVVAMFVPTAIATVAVGRAASVRLTTGACLYFAVTLVASAAAFLSIGALASQLAGTRRRAAAMAGVFFGMSYALRMLADSDPTLHWLVWLSPLGWIEESRPLTAPRPIALLPVVVLIVASSAGAARFAGTRDIGAAVLPDRDSSVPRLLLLGSPTRLAIRLMRPAALGWLVAMSCFSLLIGSVAESATKAVSGSNAIAQAFERLGGHASLVNAYLGLTFVILAVIIALMAAGQISAIRDEEAAGRLDNLVVRPLGRISWYAGRLLLSAGVLIIAGALAAFGTWAGAASQHSAVHPAALIAAGLNIVPPAIFLLGLGALTFGAWPRRASVIVYGYLAWSFLVEFIGAVVHANHWILDTSMFFHLAPAPAVDPNWSSAALLTALGVAAAVIGGGCLHRRDLLGA
jgi:ABC-2 type transport system permease protein